MSCYHDPEPVDLNCILDGIKMFRRDEVNVFKGIRILVHQADNLLGYFEQRNANEEDTFTFNGLPAMHMDEDPASQLQALVERLTIEDGHDVKLISQSCEEHDHDCLQQILCCLMNLLQDYFVKKFFSL